MFLKCIEEVSSQVYLSLFSFSVFAFTLDICFYLKNTYQTVKCRSRKTRVPAKKSVDEAF